MVTLLGLLSVTEVSTKQMAATGIKSQRGSVNYPAALHRSGSCHNGFSITERGFVTTQLRQLIVQQHVPA